MMQYGGEPVRNNPQQNGRARRPPLPAGPIKTTLPAAGHLITYQEGRYDR
jgi:hypothetical protein